VSGRTHGGAGAELVQTVRDAMVPEPTRLGDGESAQEAGRCLADNPEVRAIFVCESDGTLVGVITRKTLVREVVAPGLDPKLVLLGDIAEPPLFTLDASVSLEGGFHALEDRDLERVPVVEDGRLVGVLSRAVVQRRLAEDEPPAPDPDPGSVVL
jgi:CBS domain-containing protein